MKILLVTPHYFPLVGGVEKYVQTLAEGLQGRHEVVVITSGRRTERTEVNGIKVYRLAYSMKASNTPIGFLWWWKIRRIVKREQPDIINTHSPVPYMADVAAMARHGKPLVVTYHAGSMVKGEGGIVDTILRLYERFALPRLFKKARQIVAIYKPFVDANVDDTSKVIHIPPGIDTRLFSPRSLSKEFDVTFVGRIQHTSNWKGLDALLYAASLVKEFKRDIRLQIVGEGDAVDFYKRLASKLDLENNIVFVGKLGGEQLADAYRKSKIVALPSKTEAESFGMVLAEAQACGTAVIGSKVGGIPQVIDDGKTGLLCEPNSPESLAVAIKRLLDNDALRETLGRAGAERARKIFSDEMLIQKTEKLFEQAVLPRIVHVSSNYLPRLGGLERVVAELALEQQNHGRSVRVVSSRLGYDGSYVDVVPVKRLRAIEVAHTPIMPGLLWELLKINKHDIVHIHVAQAFVPEMVRLASIIKRFQYIAHVHLDVAPSGPAGFLLGIYKPLILAPVLQHAKFVIVFTKEQREVTARRYHLPNNNVLIVPNGVGEPFFAREPRTLHKLPRLLFVGRLSKQKNVPLLLNALDGISDKFETWIVGDGELRTEHEALVKQLKLKNVHFYGRKDGDELKRHYRDADIFVLPSDREGMPLVLLEAMAMALPTVGTDVTGIRDFVTDKQTGLLAPLGNAQAYRRALTDAVKNDTVYKKMSHAASEAAKQYSWPVVARKFEELYDN